VKLLLIRFEVEKERYTNDYFFLKYIVLA